MIISGVFLGKFLPKNVASRDGLHTIAGTPCCATRVALHVSQLISWI